MVCNPVLSPREKRLYIRKHSTDKEARNGGDRIQITKNVRGFYGALGWIGGLALAVIS